MRLLAIQELPQSKRVKLVFDDDSVLKTQPYLIADFGLYSGMELTEEEHQALLAAAGKASAKARAVRIVAASGVSEVVTSSKSLSLSAFLSKPTHGSVCP